jgi:S-adenosylmethionine synthetase
MPVPYQVRNSAAVGESGIRPVGRSPRALGPERICLQTVQLGAAKKYLERRLRRHLGPAVRISFAPAGRQERTVRLPLSRGAC